MPWNSRSRRRFDFHRTGNWSQIGCQLPDIRRRQLMAQTGRGALVYTSDMCVNYTPSKRSTLLTMLGRDVVMDRLSKRKNSSCPWMRANSLQGPRVKWLLSSLFDRRALKP